MNQESQVNDDIDLRLGSDPQPIRLSHHPFLTLMCDDESRILTKEQLDQIEKNKVSALRKRFGKKSGREFEKSQTKIYDRKQDEISMNVYVVPEGIDHCKVCASLELDGFLLYNYQIKVCEKCRQQYPERFGLVVKTDAKERFLLTDEELRDSQKLPHINRSNPKKSTWSDMQLFVLEQVEQFALEKWSTLEEIEKQRLQREINMKERKKKKFKKKITELRKKTIIPSQLLKGKPFDSHKHIYAASNSGSEMKCNICGLVVEVEEI